MAEMLHNIFAEYIYCSLSTSTSFGETVIMTNLTLLLPFLIKHSTLDKIGFRNEPTHHTSRISSFSYFKICIITNYCLINQIVQTHLNIYYPLPKYLKQGKKTLFVQAQYILLNNLKYVDFHKSLTKTNSLYTPSSSVTSYWKMVCLKCAQSVLNFDFRKPVQRNICFSLTKPLSFVCH